MNEHESRWLRIQMICDEYGVSDSLVRNLIHDGRLPAVKFGSARSSPILVRRSDIESMLVPVQPSSTSADRRAAIAARLDKLGHKQAG
ncbi:helix-turn-helix domain-containing protein [Mycolicibacterium sp. 050232]|uniref:helix-turn-helix transcriptional regulator n=1 Tax=Mycolicibacterium sp. 050232 TaxID=3113982 RepID=UPI002E2C6F19|nr:helix-turn-helix domain-containing protein [Mycolicibacterium sp. 050232]MED5812935.1 helix-turn-helix domain-containing protein [Mycolicibacterium sp. 050232]